MRDARRETIAWSMLPIAFLVDLLPLASLALMLVLVALTSPQTQTGRRMRAFLHDSRIDRWTRSPRRFLSERMSGPYWLARLPPRARPPVELAAQSLGIIMGALLVYALLIAFDGLEDVITFPFFVAIAVGGWIVGAALIARFVRAADEQPSQDLKEVTLALVLSWAYGTIVLAAATYLLTTNGALSFESPPEATELRTLAFFMWQFADAIPTLKVPATLHWRVPLAYSGADIGAIVLLYKGLVIAPAIAAAVKLWRISARSDRPKQQTTQTTNQDVGGTKAISGEQGTAAEAFGTSTRRAE